MTTAFFDKLNSRYVYRVLRPDEDPHEDLSCKDSTSKRSLAEHVETGLRIPSRYISTTVSFEKAKQWLETADERTSRRYGNKRTTIVRIDISEIKLQYPQIRIIEVVLYYLKFIPRDCRNVSNFDLFNSVYVMLN